MQTLNRVSESIKTALKISRTANWIETGTTVPCIGRAGVDVSAEVAALRAEVEASLRRVQQLADGVERGFLAKDSL